MVNNKTREQIRELLREVTREKGAFYLAMLAQSSPDLPDRWNFVVSAPWIDSTGSRSAVAYLSTKLKKHLDKNALSALDRISAIQSSDPIVTRILHFLGLSVSLQEGDFPIRNWIVGDWSIPEGYIFVADLDSDAHVRFTRSAREVQKSAR
jgi:hypothetical protein